MSLRSYLGQTIPLYRSRNTTQYTSVRGDMLALRFMHEWVHFDQEVAQELNAAVPVDVEMKNTGSDPEVFCIGNEIGTSSLVLKNLYHPTGRCLERVDSPLWFGDLQAATGTGIMLPGRANQDQPDHILLDKNNRRATSICAVGEVKTPWTVDLAGCDIRLQDAEKTDLIYSVGQLVSYMQSWKCRYGYLTTYEATVFVRRSADEMFDLSVPILFDGTGPTAREAFFAFALMAGRDPRYYEEPGFYPGNLRLPRPCGWGREPDENGGRGKLSRFDAPPSAGGSDGSSSGSAGSGATGPSGNVAQLRLGLDCGGEDLVHLRLAVEVKGQPEQDRWVMTGTLEGRPVILKYWQSEHRGEFLNEVDAYAAIVAAGRPPQFVEPVAAGSVAYGPPGVLNGDVLILEHFEGRHLDEVDEAAAQQARAELLEGVRFLRSIGMTILGSHAQNVLVGEGGVRIVDLESVIMDASFPVEGGPEMKKWLHEDRS